MALVAFPQAQDNGPSLEEIASIQDRAKEMIKWRLKERPRLNKIHEYFRGHQDNPGVPTGSRPEVKRLAEISRVNVMKIVVNSVNQCLFVDGFRQGESADPSPLWKTWQANKMDRGQIKLHRSVLTYGWAYASVLPGEMFRQGKRLETAVIKCFSPRDMTALYGDDPDWPVMALLAQPGDKNDWLYRLYDENAVHFLEGGPDQDRPDDVKWVMSEPHDMGVTPIVRFVNEEDLDEDNEGEVEPLITLQDQVDVTTFSLLVAQHYAAFRQRYVIGWVAENETAALKAGASKLLNFEDPDVKVGEFEQTQLDGYLESRRESLKEAASLSQTPAHELIGELVNLSAEALAAAEAGQQRKVNERQTSFGESWEMVFELCGQITGDDVSDDAEVVWRDTESRTLAAVVDALGKMATMLSIPPQELWERIPGVTQQQVERWKATFKEGGALGDLQKMLDNMQKNTDTGGGNDTTPPPPEPTPSKGMKIQRDAEGNMIGVVPA